jgi:hypothetical protein
MSYAKAKREVLRRFPEAVIFRSYTDDQMSDIFEQKPRGEYVVVTADNSDGVLATAWTMSEAWLKACEALDDWKEDWEG